MRDVPVPGTAPLTGKKGGTPFNQIHKHPIVSSYFFVLVFFIEYTYVVRLIQQGMESSSVQVLTHGSIIFKGV
jgi:hypothetical protein